MKTRVLFLLSLYLILTFTLTGIVGVPQNTLADGYPGDPPIKDTLPADTAGTILSTPFTPEETTGIDYWLIIKTIITIGI